MDYKKYSEELEKIIEAIPMAEHTRILVNALLKKAKKECETDVGDKGFVPVQDSKPA